MQKLRKWPIFSMSLVALCLDYFAVRHYITHNVFDEICCDQQNSLGTSALEKIRRVYNLISREPSGDPLTHEWYNEERLPDSVTSLGYTFGCSEGCLAFEAKYDVGSGSSRTLSISYECDVKSRILYGELWVLGEATPNNSREYVRTFLGEYGSSTDEYITFGDDVVKSILLKDWCSVHNNRCSPDAWGDVTIKSRWKR